MQDLEITIGFLLSIEKGQFDHLDTLLSDDAIFYGPHPYPMGKSSFLALVRGLRQGIPNWKFHFRDVEIDRPFVRMTVEVTGAHLRTLYLPETPPHPPTGRSFHLPPERIEFYVERNTIRRIYLEPVLGGWLDGLLAQLGILQPAVN